MWASASRSRHLKLYSDLTGDFSRDYFGLLPNGDEIPAFNVFTRRDGTIRHFWSGEMTFQMADPGQDPRGAPDLMPLWTILDATPEGRGTDWYPKLEYGEKYAVRAPGDRPQRSRPTPRAVADASHRRS